LTARCSAPQTVIAMVSRGLVLLLVAAITPARGVERSIVAFGDSWAWLGYDQFKATFEAHGFKTALTAIPGTPAGYWALIEPNALVDAVDKANATDVYLSIGGNDFLEGLPVGINIVELYPEMIASTKDVVNKLLTARPHVHVWHFGYEILDWNASAYCRGFGDMELKCPSSKPNCPIFCPDTSNVTCMTHIQAKWLQTDFVDLIGKQLAAKGKGNYHALNLLGTLQVAGGVPGAAVGAPVWDAYSPTKYVRNEDDEWGCVHLTPAGYTALYEEFAKHVLAQPLSLAAAPRLAQQLVEELSPSAGSVHVERRACASNTQRQCSAVAKTESA